MEFFIFTPDLAAATLKLVCFKSYIKFKNMSRGKWKKAEKRQKAILVMLSEIERERLEAIASSRNLSLSELVRYWINNGG